MRVRACALENSVYFLFPTNINQTQVIELQCVHFVSVCEHVRMFTCL